MPEAKIVLADYFLGFSTRAVSGRARPWQLYYESEEDAGRTEPRCKTAFSGDLYLNGDIKDIASTYYPAIGPYDVSDDDVAEYHVLLAKAAGIDGFMAEFTLGQEEKLLSLVKAAVKHDFRIGVNWINQSHFGENKWRDRDEAMAKAKDLVRWFAEHVYKPCGVKVDGKYLLLIFLAHPREATGLHSFFSPSEVNQLKQAAADVGFDANFLTLPWEHLPDLPAGQTTGERVWDGYFPWLWMSRGGAASEDECWTRSTTREQYVQRLHDFYAMAQRVKREGRIGTYIGAVCPGFDDHKGQAWGEALKRHLPRDGGLTLQQTWEELKRSGVKTALVITWNDWVESSQIEPSLEMEDRDLKACAAQIAEWKQIQTDERLLALPIRLFQARKELRFLEKAGMGAARTGDLGKTLDRAAKQISGLSSSASALLDQAADEVNALKKALHRRPVHIFWEFGFDSWGIARAGGEKNDRVTIDEFTGVAISEGGQVGFVIADEPLRGELRDGNFVGRLCFEYLDAGTDFISVVVDAADEKHQVIASFKKAGTGKWKTASLELVNARFVRGLNGTADFAIKQRAGTIGAVRMVRIDGATSHTR